MHQPGSDASCGLRGVMWLQITETGWEIWEGTWVVARKVLCFLQLEPGKQGKLVERLEDGSEGQNSEEREFLRVYDKMVGNKVIYKWRKWTVWRLSFSINTSNSQIVGCTHWLPVYIDCPIQISQQSSEVGTVIASIFKMRKLSPSEVTSPTPQVSNTGVRIRWSQVPEAIPVLRDTELCRCPQIMTWKPVKSGEMENGVLKKLDTLEIQGHLVRLEIVST